MTLNKQERAEYDRLRKLPMDERIVWLRAPRKFDPNVNAGLVGLALMRVGLLPVTSDEAEVLAEKAS